MRRVVVTGLGMVTPLGSGVETTWRRLLASASGARRIENFDVSDISCQIACQIPRGDGSDGTFNPDAWMEPKEQRKVDDFILYAIAAAKQQRDAGHNKRRILRTMLLILSIAIPIAFNAFIDHERQSSGITPLTAVGGLVALSLVIATAVIATRR